MEDTEGGGKVLIPDMTQFVMAASDSDSAVVKKVMDVKFEGLGNFLGTFSDEALEKVLETATASPKHLTTDATIKKYCSFMADIEEIEVFWTG